MKNETNKKELRHFVDKAGKSGTLEILSRGTNFDYRISTEEAARP